MPSPGPGKARLSTTLLRRLSAVALTAATVVGAAVLPALAQIDVPGWSQFQGGPGHPGTFADGPSPPYRVRWSLPAPAGEALSPAVIVEGQAVSLGTEGVYGIDLATGEVAWDVARQGGPLAPPAIGVLGDDAIVLFTEDVEVAEGSDDAPAALVAVNLADRTERWRSPLEAVSRTGVTVDGTAVYVGDEDGKVYALDLEDGTVRWTADGGGRLDASIAAAGGTVYTVGRDGDATRLPVSAFSAADGERRWQVFPEIASTTGSAAATDGTSVVFGAPDRLVRSLDPETGEATWTKLILSVISPVGSPAFAGEAVYVADLSGGVYRFEAGDGDRVWDHQLNELVLRSSPVVTGGAVLIGLNDGRLVALDADTGHLVWQNAPTPGLIGAIALAPEVVVAVKGGPDAGLVAFEHDPEGRLVDLPSPTELDVATTLGRYGVAAAIVVVACLVPGSLLRRRFGDAGLASDADEDLDEGDPS